jgi:hypothetical protein
MSTALIVCVVGGLVYLAVKNMEKPYKGLDELGRLSFGIGLFVYLFRLAA